MSSAVSVVIPCLNEERYIETCLESVLAFKRPAEVPLQILVIDGGSSDQTLEIIARKFDMYSEIQVLSNPCRIQSTAMNIGIAAATGDWILRLDAHSIYPTDYLEQCLETARRTGAVNVGGVVITLPGGTTYQALLVQALTTHKFGVGDSGFRTGAAEGPADTVPFGFFRRDIFKQAGLFDERLVRAQDYEFNRRIVAAGGRIWLNPRIYAEYYNQKTLWAFYHKQLVREAPYNAYLWYVAPYAFALRHAITAVFAAGVLGGLALSWVTPWIAWPFTAVMALYGLLAVSSAVQQAVRFRQPLHALLLPVCFFLFHFLHGLGVLFGLIRLLTRTAPVQRAGEPWLGAGRKRAWPASSDVALARDRTASQCQRG